jgi:hypothetical protein
MSRAFYWPLSITVYHQNFVCIFLPSHACYIYKNQLYIAWSPPEIFPEVQTIFQGRGQPENLLLNSHLSHLRVFSVKGSDKAVPALNYLSTTPWRFMGEWMYRFTFLDLGTSWKLGVIFTPRPL